LEWGLKALVQDKRLIDVKFDDDDKKATYDALNDDERKSLTSIAMAAAETFIISKEYHDNPK